MNFFSFTLLKVGNFIILKTFKVAFHLKNFLENLASEGLFYVGVSLVVI